MKQQQMRLLASGKQRSKLCHHQMPLYASAASLGRHLLRQMQQRQLLQQQRAQMLLLLPLLLTWLHHSIAAGKHCVRLNSLWLLGLPWPGPSFFLPATHFIDGCCLWVAC
jgi:hypothetical protein